MDRGRGSEVAHSSARNGGAVLSSYLQKTKDATSEQAGDIGEDTCRLNKKMANE